MPASADAIRVASRHGVDITGHQSRLLNLNAVKDADLIVTMGEKHKATVGVLEPSALEYTVKLTDFCDKSGDVPDPIGGGIEAYVSAWDLIQKCLEQLAGRLDDYDGWKAGADD
jgi:protein-tyrosine phosphatase